MKNILSKIDYGSLLVAIILMSVLIITPLINLLNIKTNANLFVFAFELVLLFIFLLKNYTKLKINFISFYMIFSILIIYIVSIIKNNYSYTLPQFLLYCVIPFFIASQHLDSKKVLKYCIYISLISLLSLNYLFSLQYQSINQSSMGNSYAVAVSIVACILYFTFYRNNINFTTKLLMVFNIYLAIKILLIGNRGAILEIIFAIIICIISKLNLKNKNNFNIFKKYVLIIGIIIVAILITLNLYSIIKYLNDFCLKFFGTTPSFLIKSLKLSKANNLSNNRGDLYSLTINLIKAKPFIGYGIETFQLNTSYPWPHNLFLQFLYEGGILFSIVPLTLICLSFIKTLFFTPKDKNIYILLVFFVVLVFPRYLISNDIWKGPYVWILLGYISSNLKIIFNKN